jgi:hypothetical protein
MAEAIYVCLSPLSTPLFFLLILLQEAFGTQNHRDDCGGKRYKTETQQRYGLDDWNVSKEIDDEDGREVRTTERMAFKSALAGGWLSMM